MNVNHVDLSQDIRSSNPQQQYSRSSSSQQKNSRGDQDEKITPRGGGGAAVGCARDLPEDDKGAAVCESSFAGATSPNSVVEIFVDCHPKQTKQPLREEESIPATKRPVPFRKRRSRGIDSPVKAINTKNVFVSAIQKTKQQQKAKNDCSKPQLQHNHAVAPPPTHSRDNSVAEAVARGVIQAAKAAAPLEEVILDKPIACPRRQRTAGSVATTPSTLTEDSEVMNDQYDVSMANKESSTLAAGTGTKSPARIVRPRPPRHDRIQKNAKASMQILKRNASGKKTKQQQEQHNSLVAAASIPKPSRTTNSEKGDVPAMDKPAHYPQRQRTLEKLPAPEREISLTPESLMEKFNICASPNDARDDDSLVLYKDDTEGKQLGAAHIQDDPFLLTDSADRVQAAAATTSEDPVIMAWLSMSHPTSQRRPSPAWGQRARLHASEPTLRVPPDIMVHSSHHSTNRNGNKGNPAEVDTATKPPAVCQRAISEDETTFTDDDTAVDDRMFQAWLKMPPRSLPVYQQQELLLLNNSSSEQQETPFMKDESEHSLALSAIEFCASMEVEVGGEACPYDKSDHQRRSSMPPLLPHRRKPSLHIDDSVDDDPDKQKDEEEVGGPLKYNHVTESLWASLPAFSTQPPANAGDDDGANLRSSWPCIRTRANSEDTVCSNLPPTIPHRHRRQDSLLSSEAACETMAPLQEESSHNNGSTSTSNSNHNSSSKEASVVSSSASSEQQQQQEESSNLVGALPPLKPMQRKSSLTLTDSSASSKSSGLAATDTAKTMAAMWSSMPISFSEVLSTPPPDPKRRSSLLAPPAMPHRRKPSLNILEDGDEGMIEMWLSHSKKSLFSDSVSVQSNAAGRIRHRRQKSLNESICSIVLKEGEAEI
jgi:hypothetical protein